MTIFICILIMLSPIALSYAIWPPSRTELASHALAPVKAVGWVLLQIAGFLLLMGLLRRLL
jgi:hypothetical protein